MGQELCMCDCVFSALIITQARLEIGVLLELSSYPDFVWCDFLYLYLYGRLKCLPIVKILFHKTSLIWTTDSGVFVL